MLRNIIFIFCFPQLLAVWFICFFPANAKDEHLFFLFSINFLFFIIVIFSAFFYFKIFKIHAKRKIKYENIESSDLSNNFIFKNTILLSILPIVGVFLLVYDRLYLRGIDYTKGLRNARYEWLATEGGSLFGVFGNLMVPIGYVGMFFAIRYIGSLKKRHLMVLVISSFSSILVSSILNGGRSNILLLIILIIIAFSLNGKKIKIRLNMSNGIILILAFSAIFYIFKIMESSASLGDIDLSEITELGVIELYGIPDHNFFTEAHANITYKIIYSLAYLFHGQWTSQVVYGLIDTPGYYSIVATPTVFLDNIGLLDLGLNTVAFASTGPYISLPGAIYYDFRWIGIIVWSMVLGLLLGLILFYIDTEKKFGTLKIILIISILYILILAPVGPAYGFNHFSFIMIAFLIVGVLNKILFNKKIYY